MKIKSLVPKDQFPIFKSHPGLVYLDNAATQQLHEDTIDALSEYYRTLNSSPPRGLYPISVETEGHIDIARDVVREFLNADPDCDIVFTKNATEGLNILALSHVHYLSSDDEVIVFCNEHHSNLLPWMELTRRTGAKLNILEPIASESDYENFSALLTPNTRIIAISGMSNVTGFQPDLVQISGIIRSSFARDAVFVIDATQLVAHNPDALIDVDYDAVVFSGHKVGAPTGIGVLCLAPEFLPHLAPVYLGGGMAESVYMYNVDDGLARTDMQFMSGPGRLEAGTGNIGGILALSIAIRLLDAPGRHRQLRQQHEVKLMDYLREIVSDVSHLKVHFAENGIFTFNIEGVHPHDVAQLLAEDDICVRAGYHCAQPLHEYYHLGPTVRASLAWYNDSDDLDRFVASLKTVRERMGLSNEVNNKRSKNATKKTRKKK